jgi:hypothetical protein
MFQGLSIYSVKCDVVVSDQTFNRQTGSWAIFKYLSGVDISSKAALPHWMPSVYHSCDIETNTSGDRYSIRKLI